MHFGNGFAYTCFTGTSGDAEFHITVEPPDDLDLAGQVDAVEQRYAEALQTLRLPPESAVFRRIYLSDAPNQAGFVRESGLFREPVHSPVAVSIVQQPPLPGAKIAMVAYHLDSQSPVRKRSLPDGNMLVEKRGLGHLWTTRLCTINNTTASTAGEQTHEVFDRLVTAIERHGGNLAENCVRTWIYVKDVDYFYQDMVQARTAFFDRHGLTRDTHYIASTGIEGTCAHRYDVVLMDAYSIIGMRPEQMSYLTAHEMLCDTKDYNVTFERGTRIAYADRAHHFISGTASIDPAGQVMHRGDVCRQLDRALDNVDALLRSGGADIEDMTHFIVYLRDPSDEPKIRARLTERFPDMPSLFLRGAVCRPEWLVEVEGIAVAPYHDPALPAF
jgi:enamine deaminase RidA (YjgF/YER057c/UK114 family)